MSRRSKCHKRVHRLGVAEEVLKAYRWLALELGPEARGKGLCPDRAVGHAQLLVNDTGQVEPRVG